MKAKLFILVLWILVSLMFCGVASSEVKTIDNIPSVVWERILGDQNYMYENKLLSFTASKELLIAGRSLQNKNNDLQKEGIWMWKINEAGHKKIEVNLKNIKVGKTSLLLKTIQSMVLCGDETIMLITKSELDKIIVVKINFKGEVLYSDIIGSTKQISKILATSDGNYLLMGEEGGYPSVMKIDERGKELWSKTFKQNNYGRYIDGISTNDAGFILVENSGASAKSMDNTPDIFIAKYNAKGEKENEKYLSGRNGNIVMGQNNSLVILYDKSHTATQDIWAQAYDKNLAPLWDCNITITPFGFYPFKIAALQNGDYVVAGQIIASGKTWLSYIDSSGVKKWDYVSPRAVFAVDTDVACTDASCYLVESIPTLQTRETDVRKIKVIKFQPQ